MTPGSDDGAPAIELDRVALTLGGARIYDSLSFSVRRGELLCLLGPSGSGKSTALRLIGGLLQPESGRVTIAGAPADQAWRHIAYVFQQPRLLPWKTALGNAAFGLEMREPALPRDERDARARRELERVGLADSADKMPVVLSGGERQRVAIARALAVGPGILLMDEPFSALDPSTRGRLREELIAIWSALRRTIVFVTHDIDEALVLADRIVVLSPKPAVAVHTVEITAARPRSVEDDVELLALRRSLARLFEDMSARPGLQPEDIQREIA